MKNQTKPQQYADNVDSGLDLSDLDLSSIQLSEKEIRALSGLTPALSRRLQQQLLASLPPAAARSLRRTLSLHTPQPTEPPPTDKSPEPVSEPKTENAVHDMELPAPQFCTLPRLKRHGQSRETTPPVPGEAGYEYARLSSVTREPAGGSIRSTPDRSLLSKYLAPERAVSLDDSYSSDSGSLLSEPSYLAAYRPTPALTQRRHSMRLAGDQPRKRISRFLRSDFFDTPPDESYAKQKKEKELETQKILREIREKKNRALESQVKSPEVCDMSLYKDDAGYSRKCLSPNSPISILTGKERSRSNTPFFPILDNIRETTLDTSHLPTENSRYGKSDVTKQKSFEEGSSNKETKLMRPKSYPIKQFDTFDEPSENISSENNSSIDIENKEKTISRESKLIRPKSYPNNSPSPEKVFLNRSSKKDESKSTTQKEEITSPENKADVEVSFSITLPKKTNKTTTVTSKPECLTKSNSLEEKDDIKIESKKTVDSSLAIKKYHILNSVDDVKPEIKDHKKENGTVIANGVPVSSSAKSSINDDTKQKVASQTTKKEEVKLKPTETEPTEKKGTIKKKIIKKVSSKSKTDVGTNQEGIDAKPASEKKKVIKKVKEKAPEDGTKPTTVTKKKSVLQSIGQKLEKFTSNKSNSPEKANENGVTSDKKDCSKFSRTQREQSVPVTAEPPTESNLIKRAVTLTDVAALDSQTATPNKTTVSKVLGLFKKFEPKEKSKPAVEKSPSEDQEASSEPNGTCQSSESVLESQDADKPKRPTSLLLNGLGRKNKFGRTSTENGPSISVENDEQTAKKENNSKNIRNSLKLDFSRLPRVKKIVPTNSVIEPQIMNVNPDEKDTEKKDIFDKNGTISTSNLCTTAGTAEVQSRSRSRSRSTFSNSENKSDNSTDAKISDKNPSSPSENSVHHPLRNHESTTPEKEDIVDRIRRKSFYSRFNEKKQRRKSNLVGPGAAEYDPVARIHSQPTDTKFDLSSPTSPGTYDLSPGFSVASDLSPSTDRYRSLLTELPVNTRSNLRFDNYGLNDKIDTYRSLDRNDFRKYPSTRSYLDYDQPSSYTSHRYSRTKSLLDSSDGTEDHSLSSLRDPHKYNRTISMYSPGNYATYRPKRTLNSAIILKESEKEPSPENILDRIRQRKKISISVTRKPDHEKDSLPRCVYFLYSHVNVNKIKITIPS